ncbi:hypothetical protein SXCC_01654 [Gluconacetobacter sp. SXCC-1]|nr:hypothetical protein SXCC_01654 [Gluconacetobacter sp. SXCC-1]
MPVPAVTGAGPGRCAHDTPAFRPGCSILSHAMMKGYG